MLELAQERLEILKGRAYEDAEIYGANEMGGLHVISVLKYGREAMGLSANPSAPATVGMTRVMKPITGVVTGLTVVGLAAMFALGVGYKRDKLVYNPETEDTVSLITGDVVKHGDAQDEKSIKEHILENHPFGIGKGAAMSNEAVNVSPEQLVADKQFLKDREAAGTERCIKRHSLRHAQPREPALLQH